MLWVVLELVSSTRILPITDVVLSVADVIAVEVVVVIDVDVPAAIPVAVTPPVVGDPRAKDYPGPQRQSHTGIITRIGIRVVWISRGPVDHRGIVGRNINDARVSLLNHDHLLFTDGLGFDLLFLAGF